MRYLMMLLALAGVTWGAEPPKPTKLNPDYAKEMAALEKRFIAKMAEAQKLNTVLEFLKAEYNALEKKACGEAKLTLEECSINFKEGTVSKVEPPKKEEPKPAAPKAEGAK